MDWGTTNRRAWRIESGRVVAGERDGKGVASLTPDDYPGELEAVRARLGDHPVLLAGMVGSNRGWRDAGYIDTSATIDALASAVLPVGDRIGIVPGVRTLTAGRGDVMRGEEVQFLGAAAAGLVPDSALLCQPGTHTKWARVSGGAITTFSTAMVGEMFALLRAHSLIGAGMTGLARDCAAFRQGVVRAGGADLQTALFEARAASVLGARTGDDITSFVSGLLVGADVRANVAAGDAVHLIADPSLGALYTAAIEQVGGAVFRVDSEAAFVAGICRVWDKMA
ncbi:2-dehydro-3-deoxygalactonokinase [Sphingomonas sp. AP4-R1]|uniref:2-dehydro-3-deoxygalactonokinase n=1 Tax=Sphingomonas sp. AP4-R1 TaxID=2735134 RepID=UPI0020A38883|nr:2-dehydro-3-deoxygalactonokinase [Sphingomonas sp. AP4-R1]